MICNCPGSEALPTIPSISCPENFGQIGKLLFQRLEKSAGTPNTIAAGAVSTTGIESKDTWEKLIAAVDGTKVSVTPIVEAPTQDGGDPITFGGGNETLGGMERIIGSNPTKLSFVIRECPQEIIAELKKLQCEKKLGVYLVSAEGQIEAVADTPSEPANFSPIPIFNLYVGDKIHGGFDTPDSNAISFSLPANYSDKLKIVTPQFNPITEL